MLSLTDERTEAKWSYSKYFLLVHIVWVTKYRYPVLREDIQQRCRELIIQICDAEDIRISSGVVSKDHVHMLIEYPSRISISDLVKRLKGRTSRMLQREFPSLKKRYWGKHFWAIGYGAWSVGDITDEIVKAYLEHHLQGQHRKSPNSDDGNMILE